MKYIASITVIIILFSSCEEVVELDLREEDSDFYVVEAELSTRYGAEVLISMSNSITEDKLPDRISNALITISDDQSPANSVLLSESDEYAGFYTIPQDAQYEVIANRNYTIQIEIGTEIITASDYLFSVEPIDSIGLWVNPDYGSFFMSIISYGQEPAGKGDYYKWDILLNNSRISGAENTAYASDEFVDGNYMDSLELFVDFHDPNDDAERIMQLGDTIQVIQKSISEFVHDFHFEFVSQSFSGGLFSVPAANLRTNLTSSSGKDVLGIFMTHDVSESNILIVDQNILDQLEKI